MCFGCQCPDPLVPPNQQVAKCRLYLKIIAIGLLIFIILDFIVGSILQAIISAVLIYFLYLGWTTFNYCSVLFYFIYCIMSTVSYLLAIIGLAQSDSFFGTGKKTFAAVLIIVLFIFYFVGMFVAHYIYRVFKNLQMSENNVMMGSFMPPFSGGRQIQQQQDSSTRNKQQFQEKNVNRSQKQSNGKFKAFSGQGVALG